MDTHQMVCMFNVLYRIRTLIYLESATPAVDQPFMEVDGREVDEMLCCSLSTMAWSPAATLPSFISPNNNNWLYKKRGQIYTMRYSYVQRKRELSSQRTNVSPETMIHMYKLVWQPSLVLGGLGRAREVPIACEGSNLGLALQPTKAQ
jgi:hypothetical protein